jgi:hypothetical protein
MVEKGAVLEVRSVSFGVYRRIYKSRLHKGGGHKLIVPLQLPARPRLHQVLEERYLFVSSDLTLFVSDKLVHKSHEKPTSEFSDITCVHPSALANEHLAFAGFPRRYPLETV